MGVAVDRRPAGVHPDPAGLERARPARSGGSACCAGAGPWWTAILRAGGYTPPAVSLISKPAQAAPAPGRHRTLARLAAILVVVALLGLILGRLPAGPASSGAVPAAVDRSSVTILGGDPTTLDPAAQGDLGSAQVTAQLFESADGRRPRAQRPAGPGQRLDEQRRRPLDHVHPPTGLEVLGRHAPRCGRRRPELVAPDRPGPSLAARVVDERDPRCRTVSVGAVERPLHGRPEGRRRHCRRDLRPAGDGLSGPRLGPGVRGRTRRDR